jgi:hypothetical protein
MMRKEIPARAVLTAVQPGTNIAEHIEKEVAKAACRFSRHGCIGSWRFRIRRVAFGKPRPQPQPNDARAKSEKGNGDR